MPRMAWHMHPDFKIRSHYYEIENGGFEQILLKHILTRNGLLNKFTLGSELSKANLVAMVMLNRGREFFMVLLNRERVLENSGLSIKSSLSTEQAHARN